MFSLTVVECALTSSLDDNEHTRYNLEMQVRNTINPKTKQFVLPKRTRYYQAMLDVDSLQKGQNFDLLPPTYIIFICVFDFFGNGNYTYTFKKRCIENPEIEFPDETTVILLNTAGTHGNITPDTKSFFDYVTKNSVTSDFTQQIDNEIVHLKSDQKVRLEYMSFKTLIQDNRYEAYAEGEAKGLAKGKVEGIFDTTINFLKIIMTSEHCSLEQAMDKLQIPAKDRSIYKNHLAHEE